MNKIITAGEELDRASRVLIMIHGRGATAEDILSLSENLSVSSYALLAPQAINRSWYPYSFLAPQQDNQPHLDAALALLREMVGDLLAKGKTANQIYFTGFSQGACLMLEFLARNAKRYGGVAAFTGGLIGDELNLENYKGDFDSTPFFLGSSDPDPHVPAQRVRDTAQQLERMNASVTMRIYAGMGHTIIAEELDFVNQNIFVKPKTASKQL